MLNLQNLIDLEQIDKNEFTGIQLWWYGKDIEKDYIGSEGFFRPIGTIRNPSFSSIYLVASGIDGTHCVYRYAVKLIDRNPDGSYNWEKVPLKLDEYSGRLILYRASGFSFYNNNMRDFIVDEIKPKDNRRTVEYFTEYESVELTFDSLQEIVTNQYMDYYKPLSIVKGVYMIVDGNTGKQYVGSAYGKEALYSRWSNYANTYHGGNIELRKLYDENGSDYFKKFKYFILRIMPMKTPDSDVIDMENFYKERYMTREFGLNKN